MKIILTALLPRFFIILLCTSFYLPQAIAQSDYPNEPIKLLVGFPPGGATDIAARILAQRLGQELNQTIIVENKPGAGSNIASELAARSKPDGYTLLLGTIANATNMSLYKNLKYDTERDFVAITQTMSSPSVLVVNPALPITTLKELVAYANNNSGKFSYASSGAGGSTHLAGELLKLRTKLDIIHIPYKGAAPALNAVIGGTVSMGFKTALGALPSIQAGRLRAIAVADSVRLPQLPDVPTLAEIGLADFEVNSWNGLYAPAGTPTAIVNRLAAASIKILKTEDVKKQFSQLGAIPVGSTPAQFKKFTHDEILKWATVSKAANIQLD
jgi:tripartite-type tricarboxylate transporter receptor subunit TctC